MRNQICFAAWCAVFEIVSPQDSTVDSSRPLLTCRFGSGVNAASARLVLDGVDVSEASREQGGVLSYLPSTGLSVGQHVVQVQAQNSAGRVVRRNWSFYVRPPSSARGEGPNLDLAVTCLSLNVGSPVFQLQGRANPFARVRSSGRSSSMLTGGAVALHEACLSAETTADAQGLFGLQLTTPSVAVDWIITLQIGADESVSGWTIQ